MKTLALLGLVIALAATASPGAARETIVTEGIVTAPVAQVWDAWATSRGLASWLAPAADIDLRIDGLMRANYDPAQVLGGAGTIENRILAFEPQRMLSIRVARAPDGFPFKGRIGDMWTVLYFASTPDDATTLRIVGLGFRSDDESQRMKAFFIPGNAATLARLQRRFAR